jgi:hypothetical protein
MSDERNRGRPEASAAIWSWREREASLAREAARARRSGLLRASVGVVIGGALFAFGAHHVAYVAASLSGLVALLALLSPLGLYRKLDAFAQWSGGIVGAILSWVLLTPVFVLFFVPFGLLFRRGARDRLERRIDRDLPSYWKKLDGEAAARAARLERPY